MAVSPTTTLGKLLTKVDNTITNLEAEYANLDIAVVAGAPITSVNYASAEQHKEDLLSEIRGVPVADAMQTTHAEAAVNRFFQDVSAKGSLACSRGFDLGGKHYEMVGFCLDQVNNKNDVLGDKDLNRVFIVLHEIGHIIHFRYFNGRNDTPQQQEFFADAFAAHVMKHQYGIADAFQQIANFRSRDNDPEYPFHVFAADAERLSNVCAAANVDRYGTFLKSMSDFTHEADFLRRTLGYVQSFAGAGQSTSTPTPTVLNTPSLNNNPANGSAAAPSGKKARISRRHDSFVSKSLLRTMLLCTGTGVGIATGLGALTGALALSPVLVVGAVSAGAGLILGGTGRFFSYMTDKDIYARWGARLALGTSAVAGLMGGIPQEKVGGANSHTAIRGYADDRGKEVANNLGPDIDPAGQKPQAAPLTNQNGNQVYSISNGEPKLTVRYYPVRGSIQNGQLQAMEFAMFEMDSKGNVTRERLGVYDANYKLDWDQGDPSLLATARVMKDVKTWTFLGRDIPSQTDRFMLDNGKVATRDAQTGAVVSIQDATDKDRQDAANSRLKDSRVQSATDYLTKQFGYTQLVLDTTFEFTNSYSSRQSFVLAEKGNQQAIGRINRDGTIQIGTINLNNNVFTPNKEAPTLYQIDTMRFFKLRWQEDRSKDHAMLIVPTQQNPQLAAIMAYRRDRGAERV